MLHESSGSVFFCFFFSQREEEKTNKQAKKLNVNGPLVGVVNLTSYLVAKYYGDIVSKVECADQMWPWGG